VSGSGRDLNKDVVVLTITGSPSSGGAIGISVIKGGARTLPQ